MNEIAVLARISRIILLKFKTIILSYVTKVKKRKIVDERQGSFLTSKYLGKKKGLGFL